MDSSLRRWWLNSSFDRSSVWDPSSIRESSFKCTFTLLIFRPQTPSLSPSLLASESSFDLREMKKCNFQGDPPDFQLNGRSHLRGSFTPSLPPPTECHKVQVLFPTTKKKSPTIPLQKRTLYLRFKTPIQRLKHSTQLKDRVQLENKDISVPESTFY